ncbi:MAG: 30S ribosomal protein S6e [Promethearchaeota archaeon]|nr:MAG: 30S ribosomal protein S6e [Candidatus Lokiarchaeota archaeon]
MSETVYKLNISASEGRAKGQSRKITIDEKRFNRLIGMQIGETLKGGLIGFPDFVFEVTGGSDSSGFPMIKTIQGPVKRKILVSKKRPGYKPKRKGQKKRKTVRGNEITDDMTLVNLKIIEYGESELFEIDKE